MHNTINKINGLKSSSTIMDDPLCVRTEPLTYDMLEYAARKLMLHTHPLYANIILVGKRDFKSLMIRAMYYSGKQIIKRNYNSTGKKNRYIKTEIIPKMYIINNNTILCGCIKIVNHEY